MSRTGCDIVVTGDLVLDEPDADYWLSGIAPALRAAHLAIGHLEVPHTNRRREVAGDVPAPGAPPGNLAAIARAGIGVVTLAGNHIADCGPEGIADTIKGLDQAGIAHCGAGPCLAEARRPFFREVGGFRVALLSYNCVGPEFAWARPDGAGCAYLPLEPKDGGRITPLAHDPNIDPAAFEILQDDIAKAKEQANFVLVSMHKGRVHTPAILENYERPLARAAVDRGADAIIGHHAHIARGIEFHRGKPIFHGLGNGCVVTHALSPAQDHPARRQWAERRKVLFGFEPDPGYDLAPFHPEAKLAILGKLTLEAGGTVVASIVPVYVEPPGRPTLAQGERAVEVRRYIERITVEGGMPPIAINDDGSVAALT